MTRDSVIATVVRAVAAADGVDPIDLDPLYDYVDPAILEQLAATDERKDGEWNFTFRYSDHQVTVTDDGQLFVDGDPVSRDISAL